MSPTDIAVFGGIAALIGVMYYFGRKKIQNEHAERQTRCQARGWEYDPKPDDHRLYEIRGVTEGVSWVLDSQPDFGPNKDPMERRPTTTWRAAHPSSPECSMVIASAGFARYLASPDASIPSAVAAIFVTALGHPLSPSHGAAQSYRVVAIGDAAFQQKFGVLARDASAAGKIVDRALQATMVRWDVAPGHQYPSHRSLQVAINTTEVQVTFYDELRDVAHIECLAAIGEAVLHRLRTKA